MFKSVGSQFSSRNSKHAPTPVGHNREPRLLTLAEGDIIAPRCQYLILARSPTLLRFSFQSRKPLHLICIFQWPPRSCTSNNECLRPDRDGCLTNNEIVRDDGRDTGHVTGVSQKQVAFRGLAYRTGHARTYIPLALSPRTASTFYLSNP